MSEGYVFDLNRAEFNDDFSSSTGSGELWQVYARQQLVSNLTAILNDAEQYGRGRAVNPRETWLSHNAILVTSPRGSGKTVFLRNCEAMWRSENSDKKDALLFLDVIDPTMLMAQDSFANVIVAQIYQAVNNKLERSNCCDEQSRNDRDDFHRRLKKLADAMGKTCEFNGAIGIDKILKYSSGIQLESYFHLFVESAIKILGCKAIVVSIDDVDMAMERAFEVVDDVRRFLGCPYLIPIVSGEIKLYEHMTQKHFDDKAYDNRCQDTKLTDKGKELSEHLTMAYLTKVFPSPMRINLFSVERLLNKMQLKYGPDSALSISYLDYQESVLNQFYFLCRNRDARRNWTMPESARELTQLVRSLPPTSLEQSEKDADISNQIVLYNNFKNWAMQKKNGEALVFAESALSLLHDSETVFDIRKILAFNLVQQTDANLYPWAKYHVLEEQENRLKELAKQGGEKINNASLLQAALGATVSGERRSLKAMPPLEFLLEKLYVTGDVAREKSDVIPVSSEPLLKAAKDNGWKLSGRCYVEDVLLDVYTESGFYSQLRNSYKFVFFSRSFELLTYSILTEKDAPALLSDVYQVLLRKPFYSLPALTDTKIALQGEADMDEDVYESNSQRHMSALILCEEIQHWRAEHSALFEKFAGARMLPLLSYCFNSAFTAINVIKANYSVNRFNDEHLTDMVLRFKYNVLNALIRCGIAGEAVYANVLVGAKSQTVRTEQNIINYERAYQRNLKLLDEELSTAKASQKSKVAQVELIKALHDAVAVHPIFALCLFDKEGSVQPRLALGDRVKPKSPKLLNVSNLTEKVTLQETSKALSKPLHDSLEQLGGYFTNDGIRLNLISSLSWLLLYIIDGRVKSEDKIYDSLESALNMRNKPAKVKEQLLSTLISAKQHLNKLYNGFLFSKDFEQLDEKLQNLIKAILRLDLGDDKSH
ncbi:antiviral RADAR system adenosine triphosphatase RdrA [Pseudoalteromonas sp. McH1-42]|uniref:antiviral RADAR system adenosine triphosphatase RdrA n=1 Tax=Pseudoalteromonas sp. McH1-42 TaxID=2917752 RepID=UPI001EF70BA3|nr:antiviral RADAR system adenosine triphosphatase RdrA [Pseudoalteromonas sp. McH1-42]MCG7564136.1 hypothetical protein [Pseudoalteromonas sp. McH1-42]